MTAIVLSVVDAEHQRLPRTIVGAMAVGGTTLFAITAVRDQHIDGFGRALIAGAALFIGFFAIALLAHGQIGFGDVTLFGAVAIYLGWAGWHAVLAALIVTALLSGIIGAALLIFRRVGVHDRLAFGPVILTSSALALMLP